MHHCFVLLIRFKTLVYMDKACRWSPVAELSSNFPGSQFKLNPLPALTKYDPSYQLAWEDVQSSKGHDACGTPAEGQQSSQKRRNGAVLPPNGMTIQFSGSSGTEASFSRRLASLGTPRMLQVQTAAAMYTNPGSQRSVSRLLADIDKIATGGSVDADNAECQYNELDAAVTSSSDRRHDHTSGPSASSNFHEHMAAVGDLSAPEAPASSSDTPSSSEQARKATAAAPAAVEAADAGPLQLLRLPSSDTCLPGYLLDFCLRALVSRPQHAPAQRAPVECTAAPLGCETASDADASGLDTSDSGHDEASSAAVHREGSRTIHSSSTRTAHSTASCSLQQAPQPQQPRQGASNNAPNNVQQQPRQPNASSGQEPRMLKNLAEALGLKTLWEQYQPKQRQLTNRQPQWSPELRCWCLNFQVI